MRLTVVTSTAAAAVLALSLSACASNPAEPKIQTKIVEVQVPAACKPNIGPEPVYPDTDEALATETDIFHGTALLKAGRTLRIARLNELATALKGCEGAQ